MRGTQGCSYRRPPAPCESRPAIEFRARHLEWTARVRGRLLGPRLAGQPAFDSGHQLRHLLAAQRTLPRGSADRSCHQACGPDRHRLRVQPGVRPGARPVAFHCRPVRRHQHPRSRAGELDDPPLDFAPAHRRHGARGAGGHRAGWPRKHGAQRLPRFPRFHGGRRTDVLDRALAAVVVGVRRGRGAHRAPHAGLGAGTLPARGNALPTPTCRGRRPRPPDPWRRANHHPLGVAGRDAPHLPRASPGRLGRHPIRSARCFAGDPDRGTRLHSPHLRPSCTRRRAASGCRPAAGHRGPYLHLGGRTRRIAARRGDSGTASGRGSAAAERGQGAR